MKKKGINKNIVILFVIAILFIIIGIIIMLVSHFNAKTGVKIKGDSPASTRVIDGDVTNVEESLIKQRIYQNLRFRNIYLKKTGPYIEFSFEVTNLKESYFEGGKLMFTFLSSSGKKIGTVVAIIDHLEVDETKLISIQTTENIMNAFDFQIKMIESNS